MKKILFIATVESHILRFHLPYLRYLKEEGCEVHVACRGGAEIPFCDVKHDIPFERSPLKPGNLKAYRMLQNVMAENKFALVHCHTPMGGVLGRMAAGPYRKNGTKLLYTAHGFHFCKNGPLLDWLLFYPVEKILSRRTDCLITINEEDYRIARRKFHAGQTVLVHGVGVDTAAFAKAASPTEREARRKEIGLAPSDFVLLNVADLSGRKNQGFLIRAVRALKAELPQLRLVLAGPDTYGGRYQELARRLGVEEQVSFLGERRDVASLLSLCDAAVSASKREGLAVNVIEAMAAGRCVVISDARGHRELVASGENGTICPQGDLRKWTDVIQKLAACPETLEAMGQAGVIKAQEYSLEHVMKEMKKIYQDALGTIHS